jgi:hypothetical protein
MRVGRARILAGLVALGLLMLGISEASAIQPTLVSVKKNKDGTYTWTFEITVDNDAVVKGGKTPPNPDFFTIYNFVGLVPKSNKQPKGWTFSTADDGVTPFRGGKAAINPVDVPKIPNVTWSWTGDKPITGPKTIKGFSVRSKVGTQMTGEYGAQITRAKPGKLKGKSAKEARIGFIETPTLPKPPPEK